MTLEEQKQKKEDELSLWSTVIGFLGLFFVFLLGGSFADSDWKWAREIAPTIMWLGIAFQIFYMLLFVGNSKISKILGGQLASQLSFGIILWFFYTQASVQATSTLNGVFGLSDSAFPLSHQVLTFVSLFMLSKPIFWALLIWGSVVLLYFMVAGGNGTYKSIKTGLFAGSGFLISLVALLMIEAKFDDSLLSKKAYLIAHSLDFNANINCPGHELNGKGVFLGPSQNRIVFDDGTPDMSWVEAVYANATELKHIDVPKSFNIYGCAQN